MVERMAALVALGAVLIAGCDRLPHPFGSLFGDDSCQYKETRYSHTSVVCQSGSQYRCDDGQWKGSGIACAEHPLVTAKSCTLNGSLYSPGSAKCESGTEYRCDDGVWRSLVVACRSGDIEARMAPDGRPCMDSGAMVVTQSTICTSGITFRCEDGKWHDLGTACQ
jgi:hypothetical protein